METKVCNTYKAFVDCRIYKIWDCIKLFKELSTTDRIILNSLNIGIVSDQLCMSTIAPASEKILRFHGLAMGMGTLPHVKINVLHMCDRCASHVGCLVFGEQCLHNVQCRLCDPCKSRSIIDR